MTRRNQFLSLLIAAIAVVIIFAVPVIYVASPAFPPAGCGLFPCLRPQASYQSITRHLLGVGGQIPADLTRYDFFWYNLSFIGQVASKTW